MRDAFGVERDSLVSKGDYSDKITTVQSHRQKANRRRSSGRVIGGAAILGGTAAAANPRVAREAGWRTGNAMGALGERLSTKGGAKAKWYGVDSRDYYRWSTIGSKTNRTNKAGLRLMSAGARVASKPSAAVVGTLVGAGAAGAGLIGAGAAHNARSNKLAREYNRQGKNSKIKIVPVSGKNRF